VVRVGVAVGVIGVAVPLGGGERVVVGEAGVSGVHWDVGGRVGVGSCVFVTSGVDEVLGVAAGETTGVGLGDAVESAVPAVALASGIGVVDGVPVTLAVALGIGVADEVRMAGTVGVGVGMTSGELDGVTVVSGVNVGVG
jgi:hypothetical protein